MRTLPALFEESLKKYAHNPLVWEKQNGKYEALSYQDIYKKVKATAIALLDLGIQKGDRIALLAEGRSEWLIAELAMFYIGAVDVPLSVKINEPVDLQFRIEHSQCVAVIASHRQIDKVRAIKGNLPTLKHLVLIGSKDQSSEGELVFSELEKKGLDLFDNYESKFNEGWKNIQENDLANIVYTSGTTADPKGIMLSHRNYTANIEQSNSLVTVKEDFTSLLILPWDHAFAHTVGLYTLIKYGASMSVVELGDSYMETLRNIPKNIKESKPTFLLSVPALAKNFKKNIEKGIRDKGPKVENLFNKALDVAYRYHGIGTDRGKGSRAFLKPMVWLYDKILFSKIRENFGGRLQYFIGGGALLDIELQKFFMAIGIPMYQGYGLSESAPVISSNTPDKHKLGSSGWLVENLELKICDEDGNELPRGKEGEIVVKGENVMLGYWRNEEATNETIKDGWLFTGDLGYLDSDGFLYVKGRFKSLLIGNDGEKYSPEGIEETIVEQSPFIDQIMLYNNQHPYTTALVVPNTLRIKEWAKSIDLDWNTEAGIKKALYKIQEEFDAYQDSGKYEGTFPTRWLPAAISVLDEAFTEENRMINSTMKMVRKVVEEVHAQSIEDLYTTDGKNIDNQRNQTQFKKLLNLD
jgi:long-chain acyl-CoA synthetase